ncbi:uncharacterized protein LOC144179995 [Haemaphysalis longicornis]
MAQTGRCFPALDRGLWTKDLPALPTVSEDSYHAGCRAKDPSERQRSRACRLATEAHCSPSSVRTNTCDSQLGLIHVLSSCFCSQKKSGRPYPHLWDGQWGEWILHLYDMSPNLIGNGYRIILGATTISSP